MRRGSMDESCPSASSTPRQPETTCGAMSWACFGRLADRLGGAGHATAPNGNTLRPPDPP
jgi:hypothetical protein